MKGAASKERGVAGQPHLWMAGNLTLVHLLRATAGTDAPFIRISAKKMKKSFGQRVRIYD